MDSEKLLNELLVSNFFMNNFLEEELSEMGFVAS